MAIPTPLTTIFTPSAACFTDLYISISNAAWLGPGTQCIPSGPNPTLSSYFSPGLFCPSGYTVACTKEVSIGTNTQTQATCCPQADNIDGVSLPPFSCQTTTGFPWYSTFGCTLNYGSIVGDFTFTYTTSGTKALTTYEAISTNGLNAYSVQLAWQASDLLTMTASPTQSSSAGGSGTSGASIVTVTAQPTPSSSPTATGSSDGGLSTPAKIALGVVIPVVVLLGLAIGIYLMRKKRKSRTADGYAPASTTDKIHDDKPTYGGGAGDPGEYSSPHQNHELSADHASSPTVYELGSERQR